MPVEWRVLTSVTPHRRASAAAPLLLLALTQCSLLHAQLLPYRGCNFGAQEGTWDRNAAHGTKWQAAPVLAERLRLDGTRTKVATATECSRMDPLVRKMQRYERQRYLTMTTPKALLDPRSQLILAYQTNPPRWQPAVTNMYKRSHPAVLFLGDHHDRWLALDGCQAIRNMRNGAMQHCPRYPDLSQTPDGDDTKHRFMYFGVCENGAASLAMRYVPGVHPTGPYFKQSQLEGLSSGNASWAVRTEETLNMFTRYFRREPDMVVMHANYWDLMGMWQRGEPLTEWSNEDLPETVVQQWTDNMTAWVRHVMSHVPYDTLLMLRTSPLPKTNPQGVPFLRKLNSTKPIMQLNEAARGVAKKLGLPLLDSEMYLRDMPSRQVLRDNYNPSSWVNLEWLNMIFNVLRHHKPRIFAHISDVRRLEDRRAQEEALRSRLPTA